MAEFGGIYEWYYSTFLNDYSGLDLNNLWVVSITPQEGEVKFKDAIKMESARFDIEGNAVDAFGIVDGWSGKSLAAMVDATWQANTAVLPETLNVEGWGSNNVLIGVNNVMIPNDALNTKNAEMGPGYTWVPPMMADTHQPFQPLQLSFYYTAYPFSEFIVRPWTMAVNRYGLKLRCLRAHLTCTLFSRRNLVLAGMNNWVPKFQYIFYSCYPQGTPNVSFDYNDDAQDKTSQISFGYDFYRMRIPVSKYSSIRHASEDYGKADAFVKYIQDKTQKLVGPDESTMKNVAVGGWMSNWIDRLKNVDTPIMVSDNPMEVVNPKNGVDADPPVETDPLPVDAGDEPVAVEPPILPVDYADDPFWAASRVFDVAPETLRPKTRDGFVLPDDVRRIRWRYGIVWFFEPSFPVPQYLGRWFGVPMYDSPMFVDWGFLGYLVPDEPDVVSGMYLDTSADDTPVSADYRYGEVDLEDELRGLEFLGGSVLLEDDPRFVSSLPLGVSMWDEVLDVPYGYIGGLVPDEPYGLDSAYFGTADDEVGAFKTAYGSVGPDEVEKLKMRATGVSKDELEKLRTGRIGVGKKDEPEKVRDRNRSVRKKDEPEDAGGISLDVGKKDEPDPKTWDGEEIVRDEPNPVVWGGDEIVRDEPLLPNARTIGVPPDEVGLVDGFRYDPAWDEP